MHFLSAFYQRSKVNTKPFFRDEYAQMNDFLVFLTYITKPITAHKLCQLTISDKFRLYVSSWQLLKHWISLLSISRFDIDKNEGLSDIHTCSALYQKLVLFEQLVSIFIIKNGILITEIAAIIQDSFETYQGICSKGASF